MGLVDVIAAGDSDSQVTAFSGDHYSLGDLQHSLACGGAEKGVHPKGQEGQTWILISGWPFFLLFKNPAGASSGFTEPITSGQTGLYVLCEKNETRLSSGTRSFFFYFLNDSRIVFAATFAVFAGSEVCCMQAVTIAPSIIRLIAGR